ncbi:hypothetical protein [Pseudomonas sp. LA5]|uniref:hypothetical protein n=1 Tax=Pseudomonas TaxID=286 RepID=UPI00235F8E43|nr:hypothetical protein [Pseudomonas sp. LA5]
MFIRTLFWLSVITVLAVAGAAVYWLYGYCALREAQSFVSFGFRALALGWGWLLTFWAAKFALELLVLARKEHQDDCRQKKAVEWYVEALGGEITQSQADFINERLTYGDRWEAAEGLLRAYYGPGIETSDIKRLDDLADRGWRVTGKLKVDALCLSLAGRHQIYTPLRLLPQYSKAPLPASPPSPSPLKPFREDDPWYSPDVLKFFAARNTFTLFQRHGGIDLDWTRNDGQRTDPISREDCVAMLKAMQAWTRRKTSEAEAAALGTDLEYVRHDIAHVTDSLAREQHRHCHSVMWEATRDDNRERDKDERRADEYCHRLYSGPADE